MWFISSNGKIELNITKTQAMKGSHSGACDADIAELRNLPAIRRQLAKIKPEVLREELIDYGWNDDELEDHDANLSRILWVACGDIVEAL